MFNIKLVYFVLFPIYLDSRGIEKHFMCAILNQSILCSFCLLMFKSIF